MRVGRKSDHQRQRESEPYEKTSDDYDVRKHTVLYCERHAYAQWVCSEAHICQCGKRHAPPGQWFVVALVVEPGKEWCCQDRRQTEPNEHQQKNEKAIKRCDFP